jgi:tyrosyl-tRNA synthetase
MIYNRVRAISIAIDVDGSPSGYISWHNHFFNKSKIRVLKPSKKNEKFGVQRMEMLAVYFAILDNLKGFRKIKRTKKKIIIVRSDSKSTIEQLNKKIGIKDSIMRRIYNSIIRVLEKVSCNLIFNYLNRTKNSAGKLLEHLRRESIYIQKKGQQTKSLSQKPI